ncbi:lysoplasmalogenase [Chitinophaga skermanii]|nr:lysoplasmalogenase [Chitinophaga skermanii]
MQKQLWSLLYFLLLLADLLAVAFDLPVEIRYITKPGLMIVLAIYYWMQVGHSAYRSRNLVFAALIFSWWGDVLLLLEDKTGLYFMLGLASFLLAHVMYIFFFAKSRLPKSFIGHNNLLWVAIVLLYAGALVAFLLPHLGDMTIPVMIYALTIATMLAMSIFSYAHIKEGFSAFFIVGASLFVISDSLLAINKFYQAFPGGGVLVMLTYGLAQWCIVEGATKYLKRAW